MFDDLQMPSLIDTADIPMKPKKNVYCRDAVYASEYIGETDRLLVKTNIIGILTLMDECEDQIEKKKMISMLKNMVILHGKILKHMHEFIKNIEGALSNQELCYDTFVLYKMMNNIKKKKLQDNIHFRYVNENIQKYPSLTPEDQMIIDHKIKYMRFSYQAKKKREPFKVGQIVGAKDKEMKWWLSRILHVHDDHERSGYWYYIRFEGWGPMHDEWIYSETFRVKLFNPRKHFLKK